MLASAVLFGCDAPTAVENPEAPEQSRQQVYDDQVSQARKEAALNGGGPIGAVPSPASAFYAADPIDYEPGPTNLANQGPTGDDQILADVPIGFDFEFYGTSYSTLHISSNGFIRFGEPVGDSGCCSGRVIPEDDAWNNIIAVAWTDMNPSHAETGEVRYETLGTAPNRRFVVHYNDVTIWPNADPRVNAWLVLHEGSNVVEIHTDFLIPGTQNVTQGIENASGTDAAFLEGRVATVFSLEDDGVRFTPVDITGVEIESVYSESRDPGTIYLGDEWVYVEILDVEQYLPRPASPDDVRIGPSFANGTPAESFEVLDLDQDGDRDIRLRFSIEELEDNGHLDANTSELTVWGQDPGTGDFYRAVTDVEVEPIPLGDLLWDNGGMVTHPGQGAGGADVSMASQDLQGSTAGSNVRHFPPGEEFRVADDFEVDGDGWDVGIIVTHAYQTGGTPTWTQANMNIREGSHDGPIVASTTTTSWQWTGIYRVFYGPENLQNTDRPVYRIDFDFGELELEPGTYWIDWQVEGGASAWAPFVMDVDNGEPITPAGNAMQLSPDGWIPLYEPDTAESPFRVYAPGTELAPAFGQPQTSRPAQRGPEYVSQRNDTAAN